MGAQLIPGGRFVIETGSRAGQVPGGLFLVETAGTVASGAAANGATLTATASISAGSAAGAGGATAAGAALSSTAALVAGTAVGASAGAFVTDPLMNNTESILANQAVVWSWFPGGRIGSMNLATAIDGSGTTGANGRLTVSGLPASSGILMVAVLNTNATDDAVYYQAGTVA